MSGVTLDRIATTPALKPLDRPVAVDARGRALMPHPFDDQAAMMWLPIGAGVKVDWTSIDGRTALLALAGGTADAYADESIAITVTRAELQQLILDLVSIDQQMGSL